MSNYSSYKLTDAILSLVDQEGVVFSRIKDMAPKLYNKLLTWKVDDEFVIVAYEFLCTNGTNE